MRLNDAKVVTTFQIKVIHNCVIFLLKLSSVAATLNASLVGTNIFYLKKGIQEWELAPPAKDVQPPQQILYYVKELQKEN